MVDTPRPPSSPPQRPAASLPQQPQQPQRPAPARPAEAPKPASAPAGHGSEQEKRGGHIDNRDQDPNNPANRTEPKDTRPAAERDRIEGDVYAARNMMTEQEKDAGNRSMGVGPMAQSESSPGLVTTMEDLGIGPRTPYPTGDPPPPAESATFSHGIKGVTDKPSAKPGSSSGPAGRAPAVDDRNAAWRADHRDDKPKPQPGPMQNQPRT